MSIKFYCSCGKHLRAREALAGKRSVCPQCGQLVGVPSLAATQRGTAPEPMSPGEKARLGRGATCAAPPLEAVPPPDPAGKPRRRWLRRMRALEKHWYECLWFPLYAANFLLPLAAALTILSGVTMLAWVNIQESNAPPTWVWLVCGVLPFMTVAYVCGLLHSVLASGAAGETGFSRWPGADLAALLRALVGWLVCFLAGPIVFAAVALAFWYYAGDFRWFDWVILSELVIIGAGHWLLALVAVHQGDRLRDANPWCVGDLIRRLGVRVVLATFAAIGVCLLIGWLILEACVWLHEEPVHGWPVLLLGWLTLLVWLTFLFRLLGIWCFQSRVEAWDEMPSPRQEAVQRLPGPLVR